MVCRKLALLTLLLFTLVFSASPASGREELPRPSPADLAAALDAARAPAAIGFAKTNFRQVHGTEPASVTVADHGVPVYVLNPDFVRGTPGAQAGVLQYIAFTATADSGTRATLRADPDGKGGWAVGSVFSGDDEEALSRRLPSGAVLLNEPQINGWYELTPDGVVLLQASLPQSPVGARLALADYQRHVGSRYGDRLADGGRGIGFTQQQPARPPSGPSPWLLSLAIPVLAGAYLLARRYSQRNSTPAKDASGSSK